MQGERRRLFVVLAVTLIFAAFCMGTKRRPELANVDFGVGRGVFQAEAAGGCLGPTYRYSGTNTWVYGQVRSRTGDRSVFAAEVAARLGNADDIELVSPLDPEAPPPPPPDAGVFTTFLIAGRYGASSEYFGAELGPGLLIEQGPGYLGGYAAPLPSAQLWVGKPEWAYGFLDVMSGPALLTTGVGHDSKWVRAEAGFAPIDMGATAEVSVCVRDLPGERADAWVGLRGMYFDENNYAAMLRLTIGN